MGLQLQAACPAIVSLAAVVGVSLGVVATSLSIRNVEAASLHGSGGARPESAQPDLSPLAQRARATPTPTPTPSPSGAGGRTVQIVVRPARSVPVDVLEHMNWAGLGGAGQTGECLSILRALPASSANRAPQVLLPTGKVYWCYCQLREKTNTRVSATLTFPNGQVRRLGATVYDGGDLGNCAEFSDFLAPSAPNQAHKFTARLSGRAIVDWFRPLVGHFQFEGWQPNEPIWLIVYAYPGQSASDVQRYVTKIHTRAAPDGRLSVALSDPGAQAVPAGTVIAVGKSGRCMVYTSYLSGPVQRYASNADCGGNNPDVYGPNGRWVSIRWAYQPSAPIYWFAHCGESRPSFLLPRDAAWVNTGSDRLHVRERPSARAGTIGYLRSGDRVNLLFDRNGGNPVCAEGAIWWLVHGPNNLIGWSMEGSSEQQWLLPQRFRP